MRPIDSDGVATVRTVSLDALLAAAFAADPGPAHLALMDARLERALELGPARLERLARRPWRRAAWLLAAAGMIVVIAGAGTIALQRFEGWSAPDFDVAWERGALLGLTDVVDGYEVTLERAYADAGQVMLAVAIEDLEQRPGTTQVGGLKGSLVDNAGGEFEYMGGQSGPVDQHESAEVWYFDPPAFPLEPGLRQFTLTLDQVELRDDSLDGVNAPPDDDGAIEIASPWHPLKGAWVIEFDLEVAGGAFVAEEVAGRGPADATLTIESFLLSPTRTRIAIRVGGVADPAAWEPVAVTARRGSKVLGFGGSMPQGDGTTISMAYEGLDDPSGTWIVTVGELVGPPAAGVPLATPGPDGEIQDHSQRLGGPWTMVVEVP